MILSDKSPTRPPRAGAPSPAGAAAGPGSPESGSTAGRVSAVAAIASDPAPVPKATCVVCRRPIVLAKAPTCLYCGAPTGAVTVIPEGTPSGLPPELLLALQPKPATVNRGRRWLFRIIAGSVGTAIGAALFMGPCMQSLPKPH